MEELKHISVLYNEVIEGLNIKKDGVYIDLTLGGAGHSFGICERLSENATFIGVDRDESVFPRAKERLSQFNCKKIFVHNNFKNIKEILNDLDITGVDGIVADLGVSSFQIDDFSRGFSFKHDGPLDMRMDNSDNSITAYDVVNNYSKEELRDIISKYSEEKFASNIAKHIVQKREEKKIETTFELVEIIKGAIPKKFHKDKHPAKKTFQAIRIEVNGEIEMLSNAISDMIYSLNRGGRLGVITFHSIEDRIVKSVFAENLKGCICPKELPVCVCGNKPKIKNISRGVIKPSEEEILLNPRSRSAKLRIIEKL